MTGKPPERPAMPARSQLLPDFRNLPMALAVVIYSELLAILIALASPQPLATFWTRIGPLSVFVQLIALLAAVLLAMARAPLARLDVRLGALSALVLIIAASMLVASTLAGLLPAGLALMLLPSDGTTGLLVRTLAISAIVGALLLRYLYLHQQWRSQVEAVANARFKTLQARIRPHFLFNSMNTIASLTRSDPRLAEETLLDLADLFRAALATEADSVTLGEEFEIARRYLRIEQQRLGARMRVDWDIDAAPSEARLPPMILQPLVENAVYHGIATSTQPGWISIRARARHARVIIDIINTVAAHAERIAHHRPGHHMAIDNVSQRLESLFPGTASLTHGERQGLYRVRIVLPHPRTTHGNPHEDTHRRR